MKKTPKKLTSAKDAVKPITIIELTHIKGSTGMHDMQMTPARNPKG